MDNIKKKSGVIPKYSGEIPEKNRLSGYHLQYFKISESILMIKPYNNENIQSRLLIQELQVLQTS